MTATPRTDVVPILVLVTDARVALERTCALVRSVALALGPGRLLVQLRDKEGGPVAMRTAARALRDVTSEVDALFVVNGATSIAQDVAADGVHLPADRTDTLAARISGARRLLGDDTFVTAAVHDDNDVEAAIEGDVTGILVSPIFATPGKGAARGVEALTAARRAIDSRGGPRRAIVYALGGVDRSNVEACARAGADGAAVIRALYDVPHASHVSDSRQVAQAAEATPDAIAAAARALAAPFARR